VITPMLKAQAELVNAYSLIVRVTGEMSEVGGSRCSAVKTSKVTRTQTSATVLSNRAAAGTDGVPAGRSAAALAEAGADTSLDIRAPGGEGVLGVQVVPDRVTIAISVVDRL
jgi:hypothetical protein